MTRRVLALSVFVAACASCSVKPSSAYKIDFKSLLLAELSASGLATRDSSFSVNNRPSLRHTHWHVSFSAQAEQAIIGSGAGINGRGNGNDQTRLAGFDFDYGLRGHQGTVYAYLVETSDKGKFAIFLVKLEH